MIIEFNTVHARMLQVVRFILVLLFAAFTALGFSDWLPPELFLTDGGRAPTRAEVQRATPTAPLTTFAVRRRMAAYLGLRSPSLA